MFITFEGLDFSGKTTQASLLVDALRDPSFSPAASPAAVHFIREPGGTPISERIRALLLDRRALEMSGAAELFLFAASRAQLVRQTILPALERREVVVCDRFADSTTVYQGYGRGLDLETVARINRLATDGLKPGLTLLIDIPVSEMRVRARAAGAVEDRMESGGTEFYERVRAGYHAIAAADPSRIRVIDGAAPVGRVHQAVCAAVRTALTAATTSATP